jgi:serine/threonine-protein kinase
MLQRRMAIYFVVLLAFYVTYWPFFYLIWSNDPRFGPTGALAHMKSPASLWLGVLYVVFAWVCRLRAWSAAQLAVIDVLAAAGIGICYAGMIRSLPSPVEAPLEGAVALMSVLSIRALLVPSSALRTLIAGVALAFSPVLMLFLNEEHFSHQAVSFVTLGFVFINWSLIAVAYSAFASSVLYGLRREVREARRLGQYTLLEKLGAGGMGVVYRAQHAMLRRPTAIKLLNAEHGEHGLTRFEREVQLMAELTHPNSVTIHDYGRTADGVLYYAMEYLDGLDMESLVQLSGPQPAARVIHLLRQACGALSEAHGRGLIHRDVKPANVFVCRDHGLPDMVKVLDFGVVKQLHDEGPSASLSREHALVGTPLYLSPESIRAPQTVDARSDLYSLGAVAYMLLTGRPVFGGATLVEICAHHLFTEPEPPSTHVDGIPTDLQGVVMHCLAKDQNQRFANAEELAASLAACADANGWTTAHARAWWAAHAARIEARREAKAAGIPTGVDFQQTVEVDALRRTAPGKVVPI